LPSVAVRLGVAGIALESEEGRQRPALQRFRLDQPVGGLQQEKKIA
jgi:hypothetical protein